MFAKILEAFYVKVLVNIILKQSTTVVYIEVHSKKGAINSAHAEFDTLEPNEKMLDFIEQYTRESPYYYIALLDISSLQGALPTCSKAKLPEYYDLSSCDYKCYDGKWTYYTATSEIMEIQKRFEEPGIDFIFSPFVILAKFFEDKIAGSLALYVLVCDRYISLAIFEEGALRFAEHLEMEEGFNTEDILENEEIEEEENAFDLDMEDGIDLESLDVDDEASELEEFGDIEDLDSLEEIEEFDESKDLEEELLESEDSLEDAAEESFNNDYQRFSFIQTAVDHYYKDDRYESNFLENIYIADAIGVSKDLKKYLEEEMFLNVYIRHIEIDAELCELTREELGLV